MTTKHKICILGGFAVGKTSLVERFVSSMFSDKYLTTVGVKVDKKVVSVNGHEVSLLIWDIYGEDALQKIRSSYVRGAAGYLLVADGTRADTLETAGSIQARMISELGAVPFVLLVNKHDLREAWQVQEADLDKFRARGWTVLCCSALTGENVEAGFMQLAAGIRRGTA